MMTTQSLRRTNYEAEMTQPQIPPAGIRNKFDESANDALTWSGGRRPQTPETIKKYRQSTVHEPGKIIRHPGLAGDPVPAGPFGVKTAAAGGQNITEAINVYPESELSRWKLEQAEAIYASSQREPLGHGYLRGHKIPAGLGTERPFGVTYDARGKELARQAATVIFPTDKAPEEDPGVRSLYVRSHADYAPAEQRRRNYDWAKAGVDPSTHRFGAIDPNPERDGVRKAVQPNLDPNLQPPRVLPKLHEDYKATATDYLGKPRQLGTGDRTLPPTHTFGVPSMRKGREAGVAELMAGYYPPPEQDPDADLGKSLREGFRNQTKPGDETRSFGIPTIRTDLRLPRLRSVADPQNYGNESDAGQVLRPPLAADLGISDEQFVALRPKEDIRQLVREAGLTLTDDEFDAAWALAADADGAAAAASAAAATTNSTVATASADAQPRACIDTFFRARHHLLAQTLRIPPPF
ncbi:hypothetical protein Vretimale_15344 [Volvox reticuliferus]|uniref:EFHB C-terminal EF-hand domain-containing protein n=1 Tax=Volvox reticuliferus TaxID=1737510 RepID=A0A8J4GQD4_9CHLO|nr:hypothetical protein Vretifemale_16497 [Volvox reticuliferus]GIM11877.1 hypothetical protein Vretimale_15344 [Volvox reticuliferus]